MAANKNKKEDWKFEGFSFPTTTPVPDQVFDELLYHLSPTEIVVLLYIIRRTFGFKKTSDNISLKQLCEGITTSDGRILDRGTGLSKSTVTRALKKLETKGVINRIRRRSRKKGDQPTTYELNFITPVSHFETRGVSGMQQGVSRQRDTQQTVKQQTDSVVVKELIRRGITKKIAEQLANDYSEDLIREKIELLDYLVEIDSPLISQNPAGYLRKAITENYEPPKGFQTRVEREEERVKREQLQQEIIAEKQAEKEKEQAYIDRIVSTYQVSPDLIDAWDKVMEQLELDLQRKVIDTWFHNTYLLSVDDGLATVGVKTQDEKKWLESRAEAMIRRLLQGILNRGDIIEVKFEIIPKDLFRD